MTDKQDTITSDTILEKVKKNQFVVLSGERGLGQVEMAQAALKGQRSVELVCCDGSWHSNGYLAGFEELITRALEYCEDAKLHYVTQSQQTLKRIRPLYESKFFTTPKDLTNTSTKEERTRFYHHEYQNKLLVGLAEFLIQCLKAQEKRFVLLIDNASNLSPTSVSLLKIFQRFPNSSDQIKFILIDHDEELFLRNQTTLRFGPQSRTQFCQAISASSDLTETIIDQIYTTSKGNPTLGKAILHCYKSGVFVVGYLTARSVLDFHISTLSVSERAEMLENYISSNCSATDPIVRRNYELTDPSVRDELHIKYHEMRMSEYREGGSPLIIIHGVMINDKTAKLTALAEPSEIIKSIGLYDTWFSYFSSLFVDEDLRKMGSGDQDENAVFVNAAFVLYSLGCGVVSVPYLDGFYQNFPKSKFVPTVLYAQSMTYGRYQLPVNLPVAEDYALRNLETIGKEFSDHEKYHYIKVFAENAYAYIKARQGKFDEALELCTVGNQKMVDVYGTDRFTLHQSILIYNTSQVYEIIRDYPNAEKQLNLAIEYDPYYGEYQNDLGNMLSKIDGRAEDALRAYERAFELCPPYHECHLNRGYLLTKLDRLADAENDFKRVLEIKPDETRALIELGNIELGRSNVAQALAFYEHAERIEPNNPDLLSNLGLAMSEMSDTDSSIAYYEKALEISPDNALVHNNLAIELFNANNQSKALTHADLALKHGPNDPDIMQTREHIASNMIAA